MLGVLVRVVVSAVHRLAQLPAAAGTVGTSFTCSATAGSRPVELRVVSGALLSSPLGEGLPVQRSPPNAATALSKSCSGDCCAAGMTSFWPMAVVNHSAYSSRYSTCVKPAGGRVRVASKGCLSTHSHACLGQSIMWSCTSHIIQQVWGQACVSAVLHS